MGKTSRQRQLLLFQSFVSSLHICVSQFVISDLCKMTSLSLLIFEHGYSFGIISGIVEGLMAKYTFMAFIHQTVSSAFPEKSVGSAAFISVVLVVVDIEFAGGGLELTGGCGGGTGVEGVVIKGVAGVTLRPVPSPTLYTGSV